MVSMEQIKQEWTKKWGAVTARGMMARDMGGYAYDAMSRRGRGRDEEPDSEPSKGVMRWREKVGMGREDDSASGLGQIKTFLQNRLSSQDYARLEQMLQQLGGGGEEDEPAQDDPPDFRGRPRLPSERSGQADLIPNGPGYQNIPEENRREMGQDSRGGGYFDRFPSASRIDVNNYGGGGRS